MKYLTLPLLLLSLHTNAQNYPPPYLAYADHFIMTMFKLKVDEIQKFIPENIQPLADDSGEVNAGLEIYQVSKVSGLPKPYAVSIVFIEVENFDTPDLPGHYALWGVINDSIVATHYAHHFGFPFTYASSISLNSMNNQSLGEVLLMKNGNSIKLALSQTEEILESQGRVKMAASDDGTLQYSEVPWINTGYVAELLNLEVHTNHPILSLLAKVKPFWSMISYDQTFTYTKSQKIN